MARAIGQVNISASTMHRMPVPMPPLPRQQELMGRYKLQIEALRDARRVIEDRRKHIEALPSAVLEQAFSGEL